MIRPCWFKRWKRLWGRLPISRSQLARGCRPGRPRLGLEELGPRWLPDATGAFGSALLLLPDSGAPAVAHGDLNHDSYPDLVTTDYAAGTVSVRLGHGDGTFHDPVAFAVGAGPVAVILADGNRDGRLDVVVANSQDGTVGVLLGIGDGTFLPVVAFPAGTRPSALAAGDLNGDGFDDLVAADSGSGRVTVMLGRPAAVPTQSWVTVGEGAAAVALDDLNRDGILDIVVVNSLSHDVTVLLGYGDGTFLTLHAVPVGAAPVAVDTGDVNGDGRPDVITANPNDGSVTVLPGRGDGTFQTPTRIAVGTAPVSVVVGDFDGDGHADLAVADHNGDRVAVLLGRGDRTFLAQSPVSVGNYPFAVVAGDFNNDGRLDLAAANGLGVPTSVALGLGTGGFVEPGASIPPVQSPPLVADFDGDGILDVVNLRKDGVMLFRPGRAGGDTAFGSQVVLNPDPVWAVRRVTAGFGQGMTVLVAVNARTNVAAVYTWVGDRFAVIFAKSLGADIPTTTLLGDVNGDGRSDLLVGSAATGVVYVALQRPQLDLSDRRWDYQIDVGVGFSGLGLADMNADGRPDLVFTEPVSGTVGILLNDRTAAFTTGLRFRAGDGLLAGPDTPIAVVAGLFDGDAVPDLAVLNSGTRQVTVLHGDGRGGVSHPEPTRSLTTGLDPISLVTGDLNGDGRPDLVVLNHGGEDLSVFLADGRGGFDERLSTEAGGRPARPGTGSHPTGVSVADINGDGVPDLLVAGLEGDVLALLGNGDGTFRPYERLDDRVTLAVFDQNRDGGHEIAIADRASDRITVQADDGTRVFQQDRSDGVRNPNAVVFSDLNGDGLADLIVSNGGGNAVFVYLGVSEAEFGPAHRFFVGTDPGGITVGDLNGDGVPDLVIANEGSDDVSTLFGQGRGAEWTFTSGPRLRAGSGPTGTVVRDVTGDGIADILVANGESNTVSLLPGVGGGFFDDRRPVVFQTGDRPVQVFVGDFDDRAGLDLVTVNAGSNDLTLFSGLGSGRTIATAGVGPVRAVAGDFTGSGALGLLVASEDGQFTLLQADASGLRVTQVFASGLARVSDMGLGTVGGGSVQVYVAQDGRNVAVPLTFILDFGGPGGPTTFSLDFAGPGGPDVGPGDDDATFPILFTTDGIDSGPTGGGGPDVSPVLVTEFSSPSGGQLELLATLVLGVAPAADDAENFGEGSPSEAGYSVMPGWYAGSDAAGEDGREIPEGDVPPGPADPDAVTRNGLIAGATDAPLNEYLGRRRVAEDTTGAVPFPSPLELFDAGGEPPPGPVGATAVEAAPPVPPAPDAPAPAGAPSVDELLTPADPAGPDAGLLSRVSLVAIVASVASALVVLGRPVRPPKPTLTCAAVPTSNGGLPRGAP